MGSAVVIPYDYYFEKTLKLDKDMQRYAFDKDSEFDVDFIARQIIRRYKINEFFLTKLSSTISSITCALENENSLFSNFKFFSNVGVSLLSVGDGINFYDLGVIANEYPYKLKDYFLSPVFMNAYNSNKNNLRAIFRALKQIYRARLYEAVKIQKRDYYPTLGYARGEGAVEICFEHILEALELELWLNINLWDKVDVSKDIETLKQIFIKNCSDYE